MAVNVFHVEFGINDTDLTRALELQQYNKAEQLIRNVSTASYLDEGCYQRTPLYIVLCGKNEEDNEVPINLYLARLLIEHGASINYRVPATFFGCEYMGPGKTALQLLVEFYNLISRHESHRELDDCIMAEYDQCKWDPSIYKVIGLNNQVLTEYEDVREHLTDLVFIILSNGGDPNTRDEFQMTPLHQTVILSKDITMCRVLCEGGANVNALDARGNTPLAALCDAFPYGIDQLLEDRPGADPYVNCANLEGKEDFITYLLSRPSIDIDVRGYLGRTALFNCMVRGDTHSALLLLQAGANPCIRGKVKVDKKTYREVSPLFAGLCSFKVLSSHSERYQTHLPKTYTFLTPLLDTCYFYRSEIAEEVTEYVDIFPDLSHLKTFGVQLVHLMFGGSTSTLRQQSTRIMFKESLVTNDEPHPILFPRGAQKIQLSDFDFPDLYTNYVNNHLNSSVLENLVRYLNLPRDSIIHFEVELFRLRLCNLFKQFKWFEYYDEEVDGLYDYHSDTDEYPSDVCDSDLEYW